MFGLWALLSLPPSLRPWQLRSFVLSVFRVIFPLRSFCFLSVFFLFFIFFGCLSWSFFVACFNNVDFLVCLSTLHRVAPFYAIPFCPVCPPCRVLSCPVLSVGRCVLRFIFTLKRTRAETYKWQPLASLLSPPSPQGPLPSSHISFSPFFFPLFPSTSSIIISLGSSPF